MDRPTAYTSAAGGDYVTTQDLIVAVLSSIVGGGGIGGLLLARERRRAASEERTDGRIEASEIEFRSYLRDQIRAADERHATEIAQRDTQHAELMAVLAQTREEHAASIARAARAEARAERAEDRVAELEREVVDLRAWRRTIEQRTPTALRAPSDPPF